MENASKALIIAGAILLSILIIALGVFVFNQAKGAVSSVGLDSQAIETFNGQFSQYEGRQSGSTLKSLIQKVNSYNKSVTDGKYVTIWGGKAARTVEFATADPNVLTLSTNASVKAGTNYNITFEYNKAGYITVICYEEIK